MQDALSTSLQTLIADSRQRLIDGSSALRSAYEAQPRTSALLKGRAKLVDKEVIRIWQACAMPPQASLLAVGGYGRGELFPASDVDVLVLLPQAADSHMRERLSDMVGALWDIGLEIGHAVRTVDECIEVANEDITVQTTLLEARFLAGDKALFAELNERYHAALDVRSFYKAKQLEQQQRYARFDDTPYALEPNCKESPAACAICRCWAGSRALRALATVGAISLGGV